MTESDSIILKERTKSATVLHILTLILPLIAVIASCCIILLSKITIPIENPAVLILASVFALLPLKTKNLSILQQITIFYLISITVNQLSAQYFSIGILPLDISFSSVPLLLCAAGYFIGKFDSVSPNNNSKTEISNAWLLAIVIIIAHMIFLSVVIYNYYGYGYERNLSTAGNIFLYMLLFIVLRARLSSLFFRQTTGLILLIFYTSLMFINR